MSFPSLSGGTRGIANLNFIVLKVLAGVQGPQGPPVGPGQSPGQGSRGLETPGSSAKLEH